MTHKHNKVQDAIGDLASLVWSLAQWNPTVQESSDDGHSVFDSRFGCLWDLDNLAWTDLLCRALLIRDKHLYTLTGIIPINDNALHEKGSGHKRLGSGSILERHIIPMLQKMFCSQLNLTRKIFYRSRL